MLEKRLTMENLDHGLAIFPLSRRMDLAAQGLRHPLKTITNSQHGDFKIKNPWIGLGGLRVGHTRGSPGKNNTLGMKTFYFFKGGETGINLTINIRLANPAGDELGVLGTEIEDEDLVHRNLLKHSLTLSGNWGLPW